MGILGSGKRILLSD